MRRTPTSSSSGGSSPSDGRSASSSPSESGSGSGGGPRASLSYEDVLLRHPLLPFALAAVAAAADQAAAATVPELSPERVGAIVGQPSLDDHAPHGAVSDAQMFNEVTEYLLDVVKAHGAWAKHKEGLAGRVEQFAAAFRTQTLTPLFAAANAGRPL